jgi:hypothetical protein
MRFSIMIIIIPYTTNFILSTFNRTMDCKNSLTKCCMGANFWVVKLESPTIQARATSQLATQHWNLSIWLNMNLPLSKRLIMIFFLFVYNFVSILVPPSSSFCSAKALCLFLSCYISLSTSSLFTPPLITNLRVDLLSFYILGATRKE